MCQQEVYFLRTIPPSVKRQASSVKRQASSDLLSELRAFKVPLPPHMRSRYVATISDNLIQSNIDASIQGKERAIMTAALTALAPSQRENVFVIDSDGTTYVNHTRLRNFWGRPPNTRRIPNATGTPPGTSGGTGPFRRVYSDNAARDGINGGFSGLQSTIYVPCGMTNLTHSSPQYTQDGSAGFIYIEGLDNNNLNFEAGFEYNPDANLENLVPYYSVGSGEVQPQSPSPASRYPCDSSSPVTVEIASSNATSLILLYWDGDEPQNQSYALFVSLGSQYSWSATGSSNRMARMTTIAQRPPGNLADGSVFGLYNNTTTPAIQWYDSAIEIVPPSGNPTWEEWGLYHWTNYQNYPTNSDSATVPADTSSTGNKFIFVNLNGNLTNGAPESDGIRLPTPSPSPTGHPTGGG